MAPTDGSGGFGAVYRALGVRPLVNAAGTKTRLGGGGMSGEVLDAMRNAAAASVDLAELQAAASRVIAELTGAEAGYVTSGAAAGLLLGAAAALAGDDAALIDRLPDTEGLPNELVIFRSHRNSYDHAWRAAGARLVEVGLDDRTAGSGVRDLDPAELEDAIGERTVGLAYVANRADRPPLATFVEVARRHRLPVLVDAAAMLPPPANLRAYIDAGADLVAFSGGKAVGGPQNTGFLAGRRDLIRSAAMSHLDLDVDTTAWRLPEEFDPEGVVRRLPRHGIGRPAKVSKEAVVGALVALRRFVEGAWPEDVAEKVVFAERLLDAARGAVGVTVEGTADEVPRLRLAFDSATAAAAFADAMRRGEPAIEVDAGRAADALVTIDTLTIASEHLATVLERALAALQAATAPYRR